MDAYYEKRPSKAWLKANVAYIDSCSKEDKDFLVGWGLNFYIFVNGTPLRRTYLAVYASILLHFVNQVPSMKKDELYCGTWVWQFI